MEIQRVHKRGSATGHYGIPTIGAAAMKGHSECQLAYIVAQRGLRLVVDLSHRERLAVRQLAFRD
jgi:hypothetical protein